MNRIKYTNTRAEVVKLQLKSGFAVLPGNSEVILGELVAAPTFVVVTQEGEPAPVVEAPVVEAAAVTPKKKATKKAPKKPASEE